MKKRIFILTLLTLLTASPAWAGWYFSLGYGYYPLFYSRYGRAVFVSYPSQPIYGETVPVGYHGYPLFPTSGYRTGSAGGYGSSMRTIEQIMAISEEKRIQWRASQEQKPSVATVEPAQSAPAVEPEYTPPVIKEPPLEAPKVQTDKSEI